MTTTTAQLDTETPTKTNAMNACNTGSACSSGGANAGNVANLVNNFENDGRNNIASTSKKNKFINSTNQKVIVNSEGDNNNSYDGGGAVTNPRVINDMGKRKKLKSRSSTLPNNPTFAKEHLDAWLDSCLKDASNLHLSSSSEFLDYNPTPNSANMLHNKLQQLQQQQQHYQQQQTIKPSTQFAIRTKANSNSNSISNLMQTSSAGYPYLNGYGGFQLPFSQGFQQGLSNFAKPSNRYSLMFPNSVGNYFSQNDGSQDFTSLPPIVNLMGGSSVAGSGGGDVGGMGIIGSSELENNSSDHIDANDSNPNMTRGFRFSDPCLLNPSDNDSKNSDQNATDTRNNVSNDENNKFFTALMEQINLLHETNSKICRNLHETKVDIEALKHAPTWGMRHRRDSLSGLSTHSQPMVFGGGFGTHSPAPTYHSGAYTPGMMTDVVREVKEAARVREDALLNRVKAMVEERQWIMNEWNIRTMRDIEELKAHIHHLRVDRKDMNKRINHLETENKYMRQMIATFFNNRTLSDIIYENEIERTRKINQNNQTSRRSQQLNLNYGTIHQHPTTSVLLDDEEDENVAEPLHILETPSTPSTAELNTIRKTRITPASDNHRHSFSSSDDSGNERIMETSSTRRSSVHHISINGISSNDLPQKYSTTQTNNIDIDHENSTNLNETISKMESKELQRELLHDIVAASKDADQRIIALEKLVKKRHKKSTSNHFQLKGNDNKSIGGGGYDGCVEANNDDHLGVGETKKFNKTLSALPIKQISTSSAPRQWQIIYKNTEATNTNSPQYLNHSTHQHQQQQHIYNKQNVLSSSHQLHHHSSNHQNLAQATISSSMNITQTMPKLSVAGPITDL